MVLVTWVDSSFDHFLLQDFTELVAADASHERRRVRNADQPLQ